MRTRISMLFNLVMRAFTFLTTNSHVSSHTCHAKYHIFIISQLTQNIIVVFTFDHHTIIRDLTDLRYLSSLFLFHTHITHCRRLSISHRVLFWNRFLELSIKISVWFLLLIDLFVSIVSNLRLHCNPWEAFAFFCKCIRRLITLCKCFWP